LFTFIFFHFGKLSAALLSFILREIVVLRIVRLKVLTASISTASPGRISTSSMTGRDVRCALCFVRCALCFAKFRCLQLKDLRLKDL